MDQEWAAILARPDVRRFERWVVAVNALIALASIGIAAYVYFHYSLPPAIQYPGLNKWGQPFAPVGIFSYLFVFTIFQVFVAIMPVVGRLSSSMFSNDQLVAGVQQIFPSARPSQPSAGLIKSTLAGFVAVEVVLFSATIYRVVFAVTAAM